MDRIRVPIDDVNILLLDIGFKVINKYFKIDYEVEDGKFLVIRHE